MSGRGALLPVLDLRYGVVVRGVAGERAQYRPVVSRLTPSAVPLDVARALREAYACHDIYVADLDAILDHRPQIDIYRELADDGFRLTLDPGVRTLDDAAAVLQQGAARVCLALETLRSPDELAACVREFGAERLVFSLDLRDGRAVCAEGSVWPAREPCEFAQAAVASGVTQLLVLDVAIVGTGLGPLTVPLCTEIRRAFPQLTLLSGGGVRDRADSVRLAEAGVDEILVASALHDGRW